MAGFKEKEVNVYTQDGKLFVEGEKEDKETETNYLHKGLDQRDFTRAWTLSDDTEVRSVDFEDKFENLSWKDRAYASST